MNLRKLHKILGLLMLLPFIGWVFTGVVFLVKPGYEQAYEKISPRLYEMEQAFQMPAGQGWLESRVLKTGLGTHLLVNIDDQWQHLEADSLRVVAKPDEQQIVRLLEDAVSVNKARYGVVEYVDGERFLTSTGVTLTLDWNTMTITQRGRDTRLISTLYKIHYLQWFGQKQLDIVLGVIGLLSLFVLALFGALLSLRKYKDSDDA